MRRHTALPMALVAPLLLIGCVGLPEQGFATRYLGGPNGNILRDTFEPSSGFDGQASPAEASEPIPKPAYKDKCEWAARERANDVLEQGFDGDTQENVYRATLADCRRWAARH